MGNELPVGELPEKFTTDREIIAKLEAAGISREQALKALANQAAYVISVRRGDLVQDAPTESAEIAALEKVEKFGFNSADSKTLEKAHEALSSLLNCFKA